MPVPPCCWPWSRWLLPDCSRRVGSGAAELAGAAAWRFCAEAAIKRPRFAMRILFATPTRIGAAVLAPGILSHLIARFPDARLTIAAGPAAAPLFAAVPGLEQLITVHKRRWALHWLALYARTVGRG